MKKTFRESTRTFFTALIAALLVLSFASIAFAETDEDAAAPAAGPSAWRETFWSPGVALYNWKDFSGANSSESGALWSLGATGTAALGGSWFVRPAAEVFIGSVSYSGSSINNTFSPGPSGGTDYLGFKVGADVGRDLVLKRSVAIGIEPFAGVGLRYWHRDVKPKNTSGVLEHWTSAYARGGVRAIVPFSKENKGFVEAGVAIPVFTRVSASGGATDSPNPSGKLTAFAEAGLDLGNVRPSIFYEGWHFGRDKQLPEGEANITGVRLGISF